MRTMIAITSLAMALSSATAQKADRYPDPDLDGPRVVRTIPITPSFDQRWYGPREADRWISNQPPPSDRFTPLATQQPAEAQNAPTGLPAAVGVVPVPGNRLRHDPIVTQAALPKAKTLGEDTRPAQVLCIKNNMRTVWYGSSWRCRK
jgi:hypothetical protein